LHQTHKLASFDYLPVPLGKPNASKAGTKLLTKNLKTRKPANAASMRGFVVKAKPQRKRRRRDWLCYKPFTSVAQ
tara:strand:- start:116 stop:340 length:225 start_codon:yes stop_codon:yes gene_type:complete